MPKFSSSCTVKQKDPWIVNVLVRVWNQYKYFNLTSVGKQSLFAKSCSKHFVVVSLSFFVLLYYSAFVFDSNIWREALILIISEWHSYCSKWCDWITAAITQGMSVFFLWIKSLLFSAQNMSSNCSFCFFTILHFSIMKKKFPRIFLWLIYFISSQHFVLILVCNYLKVSVIKIRRPHIRWYIWHIVAIFN